MALSKTDWARLSAVRVFMFYIIKIISKENFKNFTLLNNSIKIPANYDKIEVIVINYMYHMERT